jgi:hypothetical protein
MTGVLIIGHTTYNYWPLWLRRYETVHCGRYVQMLHRILLPQPSAYLLQCRWTSTILGAHNFLNNLGASSPRWGPTNIWPHNINCSRLGFVHPCTNYSVTTPMTLSSLARGTEGCSFPSRYIQRHLINCEGHNACTILQWPQHLGVLRSVLLSTGLPRCDAVSLGGWLHTFRRIVVSSSSGSSCQRKELHWLTDPEDKGI